MNLTIAQRFSRMTSRMFKSARERTNFLYMGVIVLALAAFEYFNFTTTDFALRDILGSQGGGMVEAGEGDSIKKA